MYSGLPLGVFFILFLNKNGSLKLEIEYFIIRVEKFSSEKKLTINYMD